MVEAVAVAFSMDWPPEAVQDGQDPERARGLLAAFRGELSGCFGTYRDTLCEVCDAVLCKQDRVHMTAELSLEPECRRGHGAVYKALNRGRVQAARLRWALAALPMPAWDDGRIRLAVDVSNWLRPGRLAKVPIQTLSAGNDPCQRSGLARSRTRHQRAACHALAAGGTARMENGRLVIRHPVTESSRPALTRADPRRGRPPRSPSRSGAPAPGRLATA
jgi:hypothetical protein